jgi:transposase-like protein
MNQTEPTKTEAPALRRYHSPADKVRILRLHLLEGRAISEICEAEDIYPMMFYQWQKTFFEKHLTTLKATANSSACTAPLKKTPSGRMA